MTSRPFHVLLAGLLGLVCACSSSEVAPGSSAETVAGCSYRCSGAVDVTCDTIMSLETRQVVRLALDCESNRAALASGGLLCAGRVAPAFINDVVGDLEVACPDGATADGRVELCGSFDRDFRDRITHLPSLTVCEMRSAQ